MFFSLLLRVVSCRKQEGAIFIYISILPQSCQPPFTREAFISIRLMISGTGPTTLQLAKAFRPLSFPVRLFGEFFRQFY